MGPVPENYYLAAENKSFISYLPQKSLKVATSRRSRAGTRTLNCVSLKTIIMRIVLGILMHYSLCTEGFDSLVCCCCILDSYRANRKVT